MTRPWISRGLRERRAFPLQELRVKQGEDERPHIVGHAAVFGRRSDPLVEWGRERVVEVIAPGAFTKTLQEADVRALMNHDPNYVLGRNRSGTLALAEDAHGLGVDIVPPETQWARDLMVSMERRDIDQMSFLFRAVKERWEREDDEETGWTTHVRTVLEARLFDVSVVTFPAYSDTDVAVRCLLDTGCENAPEFLRRLAEPAPEGHSADDSGGEPRGAQREPDQEDHSADERQRALDLYRLTL